MAEREGFEPSVPMKVHTLSKRAHSTALAPLHSRDYTVQFEQYIQTRLTYSYFFMSELIDLFRKATRYLPSGACVLCLDAAERHGLCHACTIQLPVLAPEQRLSYIHLHRRNTPPMEVYSLFRYQWPVANMQHRFKYHKDEYCGRALAGVLIQHLQMTKEDISDWLIVPTPMHWRRLWQRGANHAVVQARMIASQLGLQLSTTQLKSSRYTRPQVGLSQKERQQNLVNAFSCRQGKGRNILLFDDVVTTGSTMREMARMFYRHGASEVKGISISRAVF